MNSVNFSIENRVAVITGGAGVLGSNIAKSLATAGAKIVIIDIREQNVNSVVDEIKKITPDVIGYVGSVLNMDELKTLSETVVKKWGTIDILINAAGGNLLGATLEPDQEVFDMRIGSTTIFVENINLAK